MENVGVVSWFYSAKVKSICEMKLMHNSAVKYDKKMKTSTIVVVKNPLWDSREATYIFKF